jgi:hypothetical protein
MLVMQNRKEICEQLQEDLLSYFEDNSRGQLWNNRRCLIDIDYTEVCDIVVRNLSLDYNTISE